MTPRRSVKSKPFFERITGWIGSPVSFVIHTIVFITCFGLPLVGLASWSTMLLVLTTIVSLEAIYLSIFIQMSVNRQAQELEEISEDVDEIQEDIDEIQEDVEDISEEEAAEVAQEAADAERKQRQLATLDQLTKDVQRMLTDLAAVKEAHQKTSDRNRSSY